MEDIIIDQPIVEYDSSKVKYGTIWKRFAAMLIDGIILAPFSVGITLYNVSSLKSTSLMIMITIAGIAYKPFMEIVYGATLGKKAMKLKVVNRSFEKADPTTILIRNVFHIIPSMISLFFSILMFNDPGFESVSGYQDFILFGRQFPASTYFSYIAGLIGFVEGIMIAADQQSRSLHDRIAGTLVVVVQ